MVIFHSFLYVYQRVIAFQQVYKAVPVKKYSWMPRETAFLRGNSHLEQIQQILQACFWMFWKQVVLLIPTCPAIKEPWSWQMAMLPDLMSVSSAHFGMVWLLYMQSFMVLYGTWSAVKWGTHWFVGAKNSSFPGHVDVNVQGLEIGQHHWVR